jgi:hypothetical protein
MLHAALEQIEALARDERIDEESAANLRGLYEGRLDRLTDRLESDGTPPQDAHRQTAAGRAIIGAQRRRLAELGRQHAYPRDVLHALERDVDLEESRVR